MVISGQGWEYLPTSCSENVKLLLFGLVYLLVLVILLLAGNMSLLRSSQCLTLFISGLIYHSKCIRLPTHSHKLKFRM
ncbi:hypothetical protein I7I50_09778 [Histoplasma capsulatum G186AR]|uniref:Uncharacterized protein n=1 Tax=Ajellomyces capsulatus TaxID=5037 RepID=A0A8H7Z1F8_AJECA|nr:hypothetical protein I7I52_10905 [Histoplasma capsulatum]QSS68718.1 hypothetical protein I7I50_09778 [Histoplasma capsulatum G186AR]